MIVITTDIAIDEGEIHYDFVRSSGPGGQHVNRVATAVQLRFDVGRSPALSEPVRERLKRLAGKRLTADGVLVIQASRFRSQERNRKDALDRLIDLVRRASIPPQKRIRTRPTKAARERTLTQKRRRSRTKEQRRPVRGWDD